jgi:hypothetical protein
MTLRWIWPFILAPSFTFGIADEIIMGVLHKIISYLFVGE